MQTGEHPTKNKSFFKRHKLFVSLLVIVAIIGIGLSATASNMNSELASDTPIKNDAGSTSTKPSSSQTAKIGTAVRDGKFEFVVKGVTCGQTTVGTNPYLTKTAQGQFCSLNLSVKNIGNEAQSLFSTNQKLQNASAQEYSADDTATVYAAPDSSNAAWYSNINPGNTVEGTIIFDIPKDQTPTLAVLHDSAYSGGVKVSLQ